MLAAQFITQAVAAAGKHLRAVGMVVEHHKQEMERQTQAVVQVVMAAALASCCNNGGAVLEEGVAQGRDGRWYACRRYSLR